MTTNTSVIAPQTSTSSMILSVTLIVLGLLAMLLPAIPSIAVVLIIGWLVLFNGFVQVVHAFQSKGIGHIAWKLLVSACYIITAFVLLAHPLVGLAGLTLMLGIFFFALGLVNIVSYFSTSSSNRSGWMLLDGIVTLILGFLIWRRWPVGSLWYIGFLVGAGMVMTGLTRLMMTLAMRKFATEHGETPFEHRRAA